MKGMDFFRFSFFRRARIIPHNDINELGQYADLVVLPRHYFTMDVGKIKNLESALTIVNGKVVYAAGRYQSLSPQLPAISPAWSPVMFYGGYQNK